MLLTIAEILLAVRAKLSSVLFTFKLSADETLEWTVLTEFPF